jgi:phosphoenolpyruvate-protein phosphotransferase (PTS system enzyme I)
MTFSIHGICAATGASGGVAIGRAVRLAPNHVQVAHYLIDAAQVEAELARVRAARDAVVADLRHLMQDLGKSAHSESANEIHALMEVHLLLLQDETLMAGIKHWIADRHYNAEWALVTQQDLLEAQFDEMQDAYLRERKTDLMQVAQRWLQHLQGAPSVALSPAIQTGEDLILIAHDLSPADMMQFKTGVFKGFVTDLGGRTSHTAIVARSLGIPAIVGAKCASQLVRQDDWVVIDAAANVLLINPTAEMLGLYWLQLEQSRLKQQEIDKYRHVKLQASDGAAIEVLANIELPSDAKAAIDAGAQGVGLFRTEFLFMGRAILPNEEEQFDAYKTAVLAMKGLPITIRTIDIGADKPLQTKDARAALAYANPALGLRAIRWCLAEPEMFLIQLRALLRASAFGSLDVLVPMLSNENEIRQTMLLIDRARAQLDAQGIAYGKVGLGAMIEVPAAALIAPVFLKYFDFLSIGTNDLIQYLLAVDRTDESVAHLYDPSHPAVQMLIAQVIAQCNAAGKKVSICGEMAGDSDCFKALLDMGLRAFSMRHTQIAAFKKFVISSNP